MRESGGLKKLFRWSLRSLLLLITVIGCCLAYYVRWSRPYRLQAIARAKLESIGASVKAEAAEPAWAAVLVGKKRFFGICPG